MIFRIKRVITAALSCHLFLASFLLTSRLLPAEQKDSSPSIAVTMDVSTQSAATASHPTFSEITGREGEPVTISAREQEKDKDVYRLRGDAEIDYRDFTLHADEIVYDSNTGTATATGHVVLDGGVHDEHLEATHGEYNVRNSTGKFEQVVASSGLQFKGKNVALRTDQPFTFTGKLVEKIGKDRYVIHQGTITSCALPKPKWTFNAERIDIDLGESARIFNSTFRIEGVPVLYFPFAAHPTTKIGRQSGFLVPNFGASSRKGTILGDSFYWAINRSMDATVGAEYFSSRGWAQHGTFRAKPGQKSYVDLNYFGVLDRGFGPSKIDQGGQDIKLNAESLFSHGVRGVASINYLSSFVFRLAFTENFSQAVNSEVKSLAFLSKSYNGFFLNTLAARYQNFQSTTRGDVATILHVPSLETSSVDRQFLTTPFYWSFAGALEGVSRRDPTQSTNALVGRFDVNPRASLPVFFRGWTFRPEIGLRNTYYSERKASVIGPILDDALNRRAIDAVIELRPPTIGRIFDKPVFGRKLKHTVEPRIIYTRVNGVEQFQNVIRFDARDILSDTNEIEYGIIHRLFSKKINNNCSQKSSSGADSKPCDSGAHEILSWELAQRYYFDPGFGGAIINGKRNVLTTSADLTGIAFLTEPRKFSPIISKFRAHATANVDGSWQLDYDTVKGRINASTVFVNYRLADFFVGGGHAFLHTPGEIFTSTPIPGPDVFNQFRVIAGFGGPSKIGWSSAASIGFDSNLSFLQYGSFQSSYNWDCCGVSMEYRRYALGSVRNENQFRFAFTLANVGTFGNLKRQEKLF